MATNDGKPPAGDRMRRSYIRVLLVWVITLAALYAFQEYFS
jgi:hypothetical protein